MTGLRDAGYAVPAVAQAFFSSCFERYSCFSSTCSGNVCNPTRPREAQRGTETHLDLLPRLVQQLQCTALFQLCGCHAFLSRLHLLGAERYHGQVVGSSGSNLHRPS